MYYTERKPKNKKRGRPGNEARPGPRGIGPTRRRSTCEKDRARAEMERERYVVSVIVLESENGNKGTLAASEESKAKEKESDRLRKKRCIQGESRVALHLLT